MKQANQPPLTELVQRGAVIEELLRDGTVALLTSRIPR